MRIDLKKLYEKEILISHQPGQRGVSTDAFVEAAVPGLSHECCSENYLTYKDLE